jgi:hypothetical protein
VKVMIRGGHFLRDAMERIRPCVQEQLRQVMQDSLDQQLRGIGPPRDPNDFMRPANPPDWE